jgi:hypothetical protein
VNWWRASKRPEDHVLEPEAQYSPESKATAHRQDPILALQRALGNRAVQKLLPRTEGEPIAEGERLELENAFGQDLSEVRIHRDENAGQLATDAGANAFTTGRDIYFAPGAYTPPTLAHEVSHVVQQSQAASFLPGEDASLEHQANAASRAVMSGHAPEISGVASAPAMQRQATQGTQTSSFDWRELARRQVPYQQWTMEQKESAEKDYQTAIKRMTSGNIKNKLDFMDADNELFRLLSPHQAEMRAFQSLHTNTLLDLSATYVSPFKYESSDGKRVTLTATVDLPAAATPAAPTGDMLFEVFAENRGEVDLHRVPLVGTCIPSGSPFNSVSCSAKATYVTIRLLKGKYWLKATYLPLNTGNIGSYAEAFLEVK